MGEDLAKVKSSLAGNAEKASRWYEANLLKRNFSKYKTMLMHNDDKVTTSLRFNIQGNEIELTDGQATSITRVNRLQSELQRPY